MQHGKKNVFVCNIVYTVSLHKQNTVFHYSRTNLSKHISSLNNTAKTIWERGGGGMGWGGETRENANICLYESTFAIC